VDACIVELGQRYSGPHPLAEALRGFVADIAGLKVGEALDLRPADYLYRLLALDPFAGFVKNENRARNLAILSQLLNTFQNYYHYTVVTYRNREILRWHLFNSFLRLLHEGGINEYEDPDQPFPNLQVLSRTERDMPGPTAPPVVRTEHDRQARLALLRAHNTPQPFSCRARFFCPSRTGTMPPRSPGSWGPVA
jgi:ATP-dependent DNA helicase UvrD/PcrA